MPRFIPIAQAFIYDRPTLIYNDDVLTDASLCSYVVLIINNR